MNSPPPAWASPFLECSCSFWCGGSSEARLTTAQRLFPLSEPADHRDDSRPLALISERPPFCPVCRQCGRPSQSATRIQHVAVVDISSFYVLFDTPLTCV